MNNVKVYLALCMVLAAGVSLCDAAEPQLLPLSGDTGVHDPVIIKEGDIYYVFATGGRRGRNCVPIRTSKNLRDWRMTGHVFAELPEWAPKEIPGTQGIWAPDISFFGGKYHLYYSVSTFGKNSSAIGLAVNETLDPNSPKYQWVDRGMVIRSTEGQDDWNAIDGNIVVEDNGRVWLNWGSFWSGIKMRRIDPETGKLSTEDATLYSLASRPRSGAHQTLPVTGAIEAPFIVRHGDYWYLFVSFDFCCRGRKSTYNVRVGRSRDVTGPYMDKNDTPMMEGGGTLVIEATSGAWRGAGHQAVFHDAGTDYLVFHAYDATTGRSHLQISTMVWEDGWPRVASLP
ncbi:MAG TPA: family 43 glycosylhydrolase [Sedimentisphaerales bacterium]|nr:family 43 glycosylhydrolase [Sedimentisphaerales bacterium]HRS12599.1 family 43 glycosylhydrolase [Sedimentisphaerales bacterium]HRV49237.1 family 43 glycosylhydrolase [Sedimentisphaerales bacterium]